MQSSRARVIAIIAAVGVTASSAARADEPAPDAGAPPESKPETAPAKKSDDVVPPEHPERKQSVVPLPAEPPPPRVTFDSDPVVDGAVIAVSVGFAGVLELIYSTGEIRPQQISPTFDRNRLLWIDRIALSVDADSQADTYSTIGVGVAVGYAALDSVLTGFREKNRQAALVDAIMYGETIALTWAMTNIVKVAVRRPRPSAYLDAEAHKNDPNFSNADTDSALSFFSGHASITAAIGATATYLAFARSPRTWRPWVTLIAATCLATFVSVERVRAGVHFPTDVIAGSIAGAGVGVMVPHLHRSEDIKQRRVWVGFAPPPQGEGGTLQLTGLF